MKFCVRPLVGVIALAGCVDLPDGHFLCERSSDCPRSQVCVIPERRCYRDPPPDYDAALDPVEPEDGASGGPRADADAAADGHADPSDGGAGDAAGPVDGPLPDCQPETADPLAIFVSPSGSSAANCGSADMPCLSIGLGIERAKATDRSQIFIDTGDYAERLTLRAGLTLVGGWNHVGHTWTRQCNKRRAESVVVTSPSEQCVTYEEAGAATLSTLTLRTAASKAGESRYAITVRGAASELTLIDVIAEASAGGDGAAGAPGVEGPAGTGTCEAGTGLVGAVGNVGAAAVRGAFGPDGYVSASGAPGMPGTKGSAGIAALVSCLPCLAESAVCTTIGGVCAPSISMGTTCGSAGASGCAGEPGAGGGGGQGGGSSVALFVVDGKVNVMGGALRASNGGAGGAGGGGGVGGAGAPGTQGAAGPACARCVTSLLTIPDLPSPSETELRFQFTLPRRCTKQTSGAPGTFGGTGGKGGDGGEGGAGAAGSSFAIFKVGSASVTHSPETALAHGAPGGVTGEGAAGEAGETGSVP